MAKTMSIEQQGIAVGQRYLVVMRDCCIKGRFVATLTAMGTDTAVTLADGTHPPDYDALTFDNGVAFTTAFNVDLYPPDADEWP